MKNIKYFIFLLLAIPVAAIAQPSGSWPVSYGSSAPSYTPSGSGTRLYFNTATNELYTWQPAPTSAWIKYPKAFDQISGCAAPAYTPTARQSTFAVNSCNPKPELYQYTGSSWACLNCYPATLDASDIVVDNSGFNVLAGTDAQTAFEETDAALSNTLNTTTPFGGDVSGTYDNLQLGAGVVGSNELASTAVTPKLYGNPIVAFDSDGRATSAISDPAIFNADAYGIFPDGSDQTSSIQALLDTIYDRGGGIIQFKAGTYLVNGVLRPKTNYNGLNIPQTPDMVIRGVGSMQSGNGQKPIGGTILDMRYQGDTIGCFQFRGTGKVSISDITFLKGATSLTNTFIHSTLTTLHIHDCAFLGFSAASRNRAIVLGGNTAFVSSPDTSAEIGFQGYGTVIENNYFNWISTGVMLQTYANGIVIKNNNFWNQCGGFAAIWFSAKNDTNAGNVVRDNLIEMNNYTYGIYLGVNSVSNTISDNNFFDGPGGSINIKVAATNRNIIKDGFNGSGIVVYNNTIHDRFAMNSGDTTVFNTNILYRTGNFVGFRGGFSERIYNTIASPDYMQTAFSDISGVKNVIWRYVTSAASVNEMIQIQDFNPTVRFTLRADATNEFGEYTSNGNMRIKVKTSGELWMGDNSQTNHLFLSGTLYGGMSSNTTPYKLGLSDKIHWGDSTSPLSGNGAGLISTTANVLRTINGSSTDARHQALEFYATGTGSNQLPVGTIAQRPATPAAGMTRFCTDCTATDGSTGVMQVYNGSTWKNCW